MATRSWPTSSGALRRPAAGVGNRHLTDCALALRELRGLPVTEAILHLKQVAAGRFGKWVEWPDLHTRDALVEEAPGEVVGAMQKRIQVLIRAGFVDRREPPVVHCLFAPGADIAIAGARVVDADAIAACTPQELVDGLTSDLAEQIPQRQVDSGVAATL